MTERWDYWNGPDDEDRRVKYARSFKSEYQAAGDDLQRRMTAVHGVFVAETGVVLPYGYSSGWRPASVNEATSNAGKLSTHLTANAGDKRDNVDGALAWWCMRNVWVLESNGLWIEHPVATVVRAWKTALAQKRDPTPWCHGQSVPPKSHARVYFPDEASLVEWQEFLGSGGVAGMTHAAWLALGRAKEKSID